MGKLTYIVLGLALMVSGAAGAAAELAETPEQAKAFVDRLESFYDTAPARGLLTDQPYFTETLKIDDFEKLMRLYYRPDLGQRERIGAYFASHEFWAYLGFSVGEPGAYDGRVRALVVRASEIIGIVEARRLVNELLSVNRATLKTEIAWQDRVSRCAYHAGVAFIGYKDLLMRSREMEARVLAGLGHGDTRTAQYVAALDRLGLTSEAYILKLLGSLGLSSAYSMNENSVLALAHVEQRLGRARLRAFLFAQVRAVSEKVRRGRNDDLMNFAELRVVSGVAHYLDQTGQFDREAFLAMAGVPWQIYAAFLDDGDRRHVARLAGDPTLLKTSSPKYWPSGADNPLEYHYLNGLRQSADRRGAFSLFQNIVRRFSRRQKWSVTDFNRHLVRLVDGENSLALRTLGTALLEPAALESLIPAAHPALHSVLGKTSLSRAMMAYSCVRRLDGDKP